MPERVAAKSKKFYEIAPAATISGMRKNLERKEVNIKKILKWLEEVWLDPEVQEAIDEADWLKFIESLKSDLE